VRRIYKNILIKPLFTGRTDGAGSSKSEKIQLEDQPRQKEGRILSIRSWNEETQCVFLIEFPPLRVLIHPCYSGKADCSGRRGAQEGEEDPSKSPREAQWEKRLTKMENDLAEKGEETARFLEISDNKLFIPLNSLAVSSPFSARSFSILVSLFSHCASRGDLEGSSSPSWAPLLPLQSALPL
jgi:hypothetical protein